MKPSTAGQKQNKKWIGPVYAGHEHQGNQRNRREHLHALHGKRGFRTPIARSHHHDLRARSPRSGRRRNKAPHFGEEVARPLLLLSSEFCFRAPDGGLFQLLKPLRYARSLRRKRIDERQQNQRGRLEMLYCYQSRQHFPLLSDLDLHDLPQNRRANDLHDARSDQKPDAERIVEQHIYVARDSATLIKSSMATGSAIKITAVSRPCAVLICTSR